MHTRSTAGQATIEYVAAVALIAAIFVLAGPAVGAPPIGRQVVHTVREAICIVAGDVCSNAQARAAGLGPCPLSADTSGGEYSFSALIYEAGGRHTLTVTPQSDGTVSVVKTEARSKGITGGYGPDLHWGPIAINLGVDGTIRERVQDAAGWTLPDRATADRFVANTLKNAVDVRHYPPDWVSGEKAVEAQGGIGAQLGLKAYAERGALFGAATTAGAIMGTRVARSGELTIYVRAEWTRLDAGFSLRPSAGPGTNVGVVEFTVGKDGPHAIAFRQSTPSAGNTRIVDTVERLDLRDPANRSAAGALVDVKQPLAGLLQGLRALHDRVPQFGTTEQTVSAYNDASTGISGSLRGGAKLGGSYKKIKIHKQLTSATARTPGSGARERFDCEGGRS